MAFLLHKNAAPFAARTALIRTGAAKVVPRVCRPRLLVKKYASFTTVQVRK
jgi:hypothetical protein